jgi:hypothetical protein
MGRIDQPKYCTEVLKRPISLKFYRNFTPVIRQRHHHQQKSGCKQLQRPGTQAVTYAVLEHFVAEPAR